ncbi:MAG: FAD-dependent monooxygenase [Myxococcota bacterium]
MSTQGSPRAVVIGGSLAGLFAGTTLRTIGWDVDIYERSNRDLESRGGGIVLQPSVVRLLERIDASTSDLGVRSRFRAILSPRGDGIQKTLAPQIQTSWSLIYGAAKARFPDAHYHRGYEVVAMEQDGTRASVTFADGSRTSGDLVIGADGHDSTLRRLLFPGVEPSYAGYLAWRGLVDEASMPELAREALHGDFAFASGPESHMLGYLIPGPGHDTQEGRRIYNWVWYRPADPDMLTAVMTDPHGRSRGFSISEGQLDDAWRRHVYREATERLPPAFEAIVHATEAPFAQAIRDFRLPRMVQDRAVLIGDAAFVVRPHTAASTAKAAEDALALADSLAEHTDIDRALAAWEPNQLQLGERLFDWGTRAGDHIMFGPARAATRFAK